MAVKFREARHEGWNHILGYVYDELLMDTTSEWPAHGCVGLRTKADSVTAFKDLTIRANLEGDVQ